MGTIAAVDAASKSSSSSLTFPILIVLVFVGFYFLMIRPQRRRQQQAAQQQNTVNPGARVRTTAGMYATVVAVDGDDVRARSRAQRRGPLPQARHHGGHRPG